MTSQVEICNLALQKIGANSITALDDDSEEARACNRLYTPVLRAELRSHVWGFAIVRVSLAADVDAPAFGPTTQYTLPSDCVRILPDNEVTDWIVEGRKILTDTEEELELRYISEISDPNLMDPLFVQTFAARLAAELAERLTESATKKAAAWDEYSEAIKEARRINAIDSISAEPPQDDWLAVRR